MKKIFIAIVFSVISFNMFAENFSCEKYVKDSLIIMNLSYKYDNYSLKDWALELKEYFPTDNNGSIHLSYVINSADSLNTNTIMSKCVNYFNLVFNSENAIKNYNEEGRIITATGRYLKIATKTINAIYYVKSITINADTDIILKFKENRIKIDVFVRHYNYISGDSMLQSKNSIVTIAETYPFTSLKSGADEQVYACAFINSIANSFDKVTKFIKYLNTNIDSKNNVEEDW